MKIRINRIINFHWTLLVDEQVVDLANEDLSIIMTLPSKEKIMLEYTVTETNKVHFTYTPSMIGPYLVTAYLDRTTTNGFLDEKAFDCCFYTLQEGGDDTELDAEVITMSGNLLTGNFDPSILDNYVTKAELQIALNNFHQKWDE